MNAPSPKKQRVTIQVSTGRPQGNPAGRDPAVQSLLNSSVARAKKIDEADPYTSLIAQGPSDFYGLRPDMHPFAQIVATRLPEMSQKQKDRARKAAEMLFSQGKVADADAEYQRRVDAHEGRVVGGYLEHHKGNVPNRTFKANEIIQDIIRKYDSGQRNLVIDEVAAGTAPQVTNALDAIKRHRPEILKDLSVYMVAGPSTGPKAYSPKLLNLLKEYRVPTYAETYGGKADKRWTDQQWRATINAMNKFRESGVDMTPMMSLSDQHIGTGPQAIAEARRRAWYIFRKTGMIPSVWHLTSVKSPSPRGLGNAVGKWIKNMRKQSGRH